MTTSFIPAGQTSPLSVHRDHTSRRYTVVLLAACIVASLSGLAYAQFATDAPREFDERWLPWMGCWQLVEETGQPAELGRELPFAGRALACVGPSEEAGALEASSVTLTSLTEGEPMFEETLRADGQQHPVNELECSGWRQNSWSADGARIFTRAELDCGTQDTRIVSGVGLMPDPFTWIDLELVDAGGYGVGEAGVAGPAARANLLWLERVLIGADPLNIDMLYHTMVGLQHTYQAHGPTVSGVAIALWDLDLE